MDSSPLGQILLRILPILGLLTFLSASEIVIPLRNQSRNALGRLSANLTLTGITLLLGIVFNAMLLAGSAYFNRIEFGVLPALDLRGLPAMLIAIVVLDLTTYIAHVTMHKFSWGWRIHLVHHIDAVVDATTALRQHPLEGFIRFSFTAVTAWGLGASPEAIAIYRLLSSANALVEHANIRLPAWIDRVLVWFWVTPDMHKIHHSRVPAQTDSNYSNLFSVFDRVFGTYTRSRPVFSGEYGIEGNDTPHQQSLRRIFSMPFESKTPDALDQQIQ